MKGCLDRIQVLVLAFELPLVGAAYEVNRHVLMKEILELFEVARIDAPEIRVLHTANRFHVEQHLHRVSQRSGAVVCDFEGQAVGDTHATFGERRVPGSVLSRHRAFSCFLSSE